MINAQGVSNRKKGAASFEAEYVPVCTFSLLLANNFLSVFFLLFRVFLCVEKIYSYCCCVQDMWLKFIETCYWEKKTRGFVSNCCMRRLIFWIYLANSEKFWVRKSGQGIEIYNDNESFLWLIQALEISVTTYFKNYGNRCWYLWGA